MSDTPRTDGEAFFPHDSKYKVCDADFCRQLERELNAANERIKRLEEDLGDAYAEMRKQHHAITAVYDRSVWTKAKEAKP